MILSRGSNALPILSRGMSDELGATPTPDAPEPRLAVGCNLFEEATAGALGPDDWAVDCTGRPEEMARLDGGGYRCWRRARMSKSVDLLQDDEECSRMLNRIERALSRRKKGCCSVAESVAWMIPDSSILVHPFAIMVVFDADALEVGPLVFDEPGTDGVVEVVVGLFTTVLVAVAFVAVETREAVDADSEDREDVEPDVFAGG